MLAFIDESERAGKFYFLGALVCTQNQASEISAGLDALLERYSKSFFELHPSIELHGSEMMRNNTSPWREVPFKARCDIYDSALRTIVNSGARYFVEVVDVVRHQIKDYATPFAPREIAFTYLLEKINKCVTVDDSIVKIFADEHHTSETSASNFARYQLLGTWGYKSSKLQNLDPDITFSRSSDSRELQAADLLTYLVNRHQTIVETTHQASHQKERHWNSMKPITQSPRGSIRVWP